LGAKVGKSDQIILVRRKVSGDGLFAKALQAVHAIAFNKYIPVSGCRIFSHGTPAQTVFLIVSVQIPLIFENIFCLSSGNCEF
jgi:hypothetical protein